MHAKGSENDRLQMGNQATKETEGSIFKLSKCSDGRWEFNTN